MLQYLAKYQSFSTVQQMDEVVAKQLAVHQGELTEAEVKIVYFLASRSLRYPGVSHLKAETIAESVGISTKTVYRAVKKLAHVGIIEKIAGKKLNGIRGASIYRFLPHVRAAMSERAGASEPVTASSQAAEHEAQAFISFNQKNKACYTNTYPTLELSLEEQTPYQRLKAFIAYFVEDPKLASTFYGIWLAKTKHLTDPPPFELVMQATKYTLRAWRDGLIRKSMASYFSGTLQRLIERHLEQEIFEMMAQFELAQRQ